MSEEYVIKESKKIYESSINSGVDKDTAKIKAREFLCDPINFLTLSEENQIKVLGTKEAEDLKKIAREIKQADDLRQYLNSKLKEQQCQ